MPPLKVDPAVKSGYIIGKKQFRVRGTVIVNKIIPLNEYVNQQLPSPELIGQSELDDKTFQEIRGVSGGQWLFAKHFVTPSHKL